MRVLRGALLVTVFTILMATAFLAGFGNAQRVRSRAYDLGYAKALADHGLAPLDEPSDMVEEISEERAVIGIIAAVTASGIVLTEETPGTAESAATVNVAITAQTRLTALSPKDPALLEQELAAFARAQERDPDSLISPPSPDAESVITVDQLMVGDRVSVLTASDPETDPIVAIRITRTAEAPATSQ